MTDLLAQLMDPNAPALTDAERKKALGTKRVIRKGHAWAPGSGPDGETCKTCKHIARFGRYRKCKLVQKYWTSGPGTDVKSGDPACRFWEAADA